MLSRCLALRRDPAPKCEGDASTIVAHMSQMPPRVGPFVAGETNRPGTPGANPAGEKSIDAVVRICAPERVVCPHVVATVEVLIGEIGAVAKGAVVHNLIVAERLDHDDSVVAVAEGAVAADQVVVREDTDAVANCIDREVGVDPVAGAAELNPLIERARDLIASDPVGSAAHFDPFANPSDHVVCNVVLDPVDADATFAATDRVPYHMVAGTIDPDRIGAAEQHPVADQPIAVARDPQSFRTLLIVQHRILDSCRQVGDQMIAGTFHQYCELAPGNGAIQDLSTVAIQHDPFDGAIADHGVAPKVQPAPAHRQRRIRRADQILVEPLDPGEHLSAFDCRDTARGRQNHRHDGAKTGSEGPPRKDVDVSHRVHLFVRRHEACYCGAKG
jgi:hypothetical protein